MTVIQKVKVWGDTHQNNWYTVGRVLLGLIIFLKGLYFAQNNDALHGILAKSAVAIWALYLMQYMVLTHTVGGLLIMMGLITRLAILLQLPIVIGAIVFVNAQRGFYSYHFELALSIFTLTLLIFFLIFGSGKYSVDEFMRMHVNT